MVYCLSGSRSCIKSDDEKLSPSCYNTKEDCEFQFKKNDYCLNVFDKPMKCFRYDRDNPGQQCFPTRAECESEMERLVKIIKSEGSFPVPVLNPTPSPKTLPISSATPTPAKKFYIWGIVIAIFILIIILVVVAAILR
jgi:hypothetical protein